MRHPLPPFEIQRKLTEPAQLSDTDLFSLLNLLGDFPFNHPQPMPVLVAQKGRAPRPIAPHPLGARQLWLAAHRADL